MRELSGIIESRPAYKVELDETAQLHALLVEQLDRLDEQGLVRVIERLIQELADAEAEDEERQIPYAGAKAHRLKAADAHVGARKFKLSDYTGDAPTTAGSATAKGERKMRLHAIAAFHHHHTGAAYKKLGMPHRAARNALAAELHQARAGHYKIHHETGHYVDTSKVTTKPKSTKAKGSKK